MVAVIFGHEKREAALHELPWISAALRFGYWIADRTMALEKGGKLFAFVNVPVRSCLPGLILLGSIMRNQFAIGQECTDEHRRLLHFLRLWGSGKGAAVIGAPSQSQW